MNVTASLAPLPPVLYINRSVGGMSRPGGRASGRMCYQAPVNLFLEDEGDAKIA